MSKIEMEDDEWQRVMACIALAPWRDANPLLMKIGEQLREQEKDRVLPKSNSQRPELKQ
jgi:hypothetical protein